MMFLFAVPIMEALAIYIVPLMIGTRDIAFPRLAAFNYWVFLFGGAMIYIAFFLNIGPDVGWFSYVPLAGPEYSPGKRADIWAQMVTFTELSGARRSGPDHRHDLQAARARHVAEPHAALRLGDARHVVHDCVRHARGDAREQL